MVAGVAAVAEDQAARQHDQPGPAEGGEQGGARRARRVPPCFRRIPACLGRVASRDACPTGFTERGVHLRSVSSRKESNWSILRNRLAPFHVWPSPSSIIRLARPPAAWTLSASAWAWRGGTTGSALPWTSRKAGRFFGV